MNKTTIAVKTQKFEIPKSQLIIGLVVGLLYAFAFYSILYMSREIFRVFTFQFKNELLILTAKEVYFYNLFFAFIAVILAQSVCFNYWFSRPRRMFEVRHYRKTMIVHDQSVLNWYFLSWFSKLAVSFWIMFGLAFYNGFDVFSFYPDYKFMFILIVIVLFLQTWNSIRLTFKRHSFKWMLLTAFVISVLAFGLSRINLIDYKAINKIYTSKTSLNKQDRVPDVEQEESLGTYKYKSQD